jgi:beta-glucosidase
MGASASSNAEMVNDIQRIAIEKSRLGVPILFGRDVIHGYRTVFPIPLAQAASWDATLVEQAATVAAREATSDGIKWTFTPMLDIARDARWGRIAEGFGEDPYLASTLATAAVRGYQGDNLADPEKIIACSKHYVGYGAAEGGRDYDGVELSMRTLQDVYLRPFKAAVDAGVGTLMSAFHDLNGIPMSAHRQLLTDILREDWGFKGFVISDWNAIDELVNHGIAHDRGEASAKALKAGVDMDMVAGIYLESLEGCLHRGDVSQADIDESVRRILRVKLLAGLFDQPYVDIDRAKKTILTPENRALARHFAQRTTVLLKNEDNILPLSDEGHRIALVGPLAYAAGELFGTWTPDGRAEDATSIADAFRQSVPLGVELAVSQNNDEAIRYAQYADVAIAVVGEHPMRSGENSNVSSLELPPGQRELLEAIADQGVPIVLIVIAGRPLAIAREARLAKAVLYAWHPGIEGAAALADLVFGKAVPSARLPVTMPRATGQVPIYYNHKNSGRPPGAGQFLTRYVDLPLQPLYPFGFGLSYTQFDYTKLHMASSEMKGDSIEISADVTNLGDRAATETVQLYVRDLVGTVSRPVKELVGFQKISLQPGETQPVIFTLQREMLAFTGIDDRPTIEPGEYHIWVGPNSAEGLQGNFTLM